MIFVLPSLLMLYYLLLSERWVKYLKYANEEATESGINMLIFIAGHPGYYSMLVSLVWAAMSKPDYKTSEARN